MNLTDQATRDYVLWVLGQHKTVEAACLEIGERRGKRISARSLREKFAQAGLDSPGNYTRPMLQMRQVAQLGIPVPQHLRVPGIPLHYDMGPIATPSMGATPPTLPGFPAPPPPTPRRGALDALLGASGEVLGHLAGEDESCPPTEPSRRAPPAQGPYRTAPPDDLKRLLEAVKKGPVAFSSLCDQLDLSPGRLRKLIDQAKASGAPVAVAHDHVGFAPDKPDERVQSTGIAPVVGERQRVAVISDTHLGSKYCLRNQMREFIHYAYDQGVRDVLHPGDWLDGIYKHGIWELSHHGLEDQVRDLVETLPQLPGLRYHGITGNHDETFEDTCGIGAGPYIERAFRDAGRHDVKFYGRRSAFLRVGGVVVHLWHPRGSAAYAKSYRLQKVIEKYSSGEKPHILLVGHFHQYCHLFDRGVHAFLCPTFQGGGSAFGNSLGGAPAIGGMVLAWDLTEHGTMRRFAHEYSAYFEVERPHNVDDDTAHREEMPVR